LYRQAPKDAGKLDTDKEAAITRCLGTDEWRSSFYAQERQGHLFQQEPTEVREASHKEMLEFVDKRLRQAFAVVSKPRILYQSEADGRSSGAPLFALFFAVSSRQPGARKLAMKIADHILKSN